MSKFIIVLTCNDTDGGNYSDIVNGIYNTQEEAEKVAKQSIQDELESLGDGYEISPYDEFTIQNMYEQNITTYTIFEITKLPKKYVYTVQISGCYYAVLLFNRMLSGIDRALIQDRIYEIEKDLLEKNCDYQTEDVIKELHKEYDFEEETIRHSFSF